MSKDYRVFLRDILDAAGSISEYTLDTSFEEFSGKKIVSDAVIMNLAVIGEAAKKVPASLKKNYPSVDWRGIAGLRDILVHKYSSINLKVIWDIVENELPELKSTVKKMLEDSDL